jgi:hypothetical protein
MKSVFNELESHVKDLIADGRINQDNIDEAHTIAFNEDYYIIGYHQADEWLKKHDVTPWEAIAYVIEGEHNHFGESYLKTDDINSENIVNQFVYLAALNLDFEDLLEQAS